MTLGGGQRFAYRFTLVRELGEGGMGRTFEVASYRDSPTGPSVNSANTYSM